MTRMHSSRMRTARSLTISHSIPGVICPTPLDADPPGCRPFLHADPPWMLTPAGYRPSLDADTSLDADPPFHVTCDACWEANPTPMNRMTHRCKNITLPQTSFVGGKNWTWNILETILYKKSRYMNWQNFPNNDSQTRRIESLIKTCRTLKCNA